jgi:malate permease and related proteins
MSYFGEEGLSRIVIFDFGNILLCFTFVYYTACKFGGDTVSRQTLLKKLLYSPSIWALFAGVVMNAAGLRMHEAGLNFLRLLGAMTVPLTMLSLGIYFTPRIIETKPFISAIVIRMGAGLLIGIAAVKLLHIEGLDRLIVLIGSSTPIGYATLTFASLENLDREFASGLVSFSILLSIFLIPALIFLAQ